MNWRLLNPASLKQMVVLAAVFGLGAWVGRFSQTPPPATPAHHAAHHPAEASVKIDPAVVHNLGIRTETVTRTDLTRTVEAIGKITRVDETAKRLVTPPIDGQLLFIAEKYQGDEVKQGERLFTVGSTQLTALQMAFQQAMNQPNLTLAESLRGQLLEQGLTPSQLRELTEGAVPNFTVDVFAPEDAFVFDRRGRVGETVHPRVTVFSLGGRGRRIQVTAEILERQWRWVKAGQSARMTVRGLPGEVFTGQVKRVEPPVGFTTRALEAQLLFSSDHPGLSQSQFATLRIDAPPIKNALSVPQEAVIYDIDGARVVMRDGQGRFLPVKVELGEQGDGRVALRSGLNEGDTIVVSGQFLLDAESQLQGVWQRFSGHHH
ncbi:MAG: efflux RND transporter periplasmic adaptor subunit [Methylococcales bacterium]|nr:efflux RND transporter periplasmic adaptor subunit [Methylococcales bacterium]